MSEVKLLSNSEMKDFQRCKRKWWLSYIRGLQRVAADAPMSPTHIGTTVHDALAAYYDPEQRTDPVAFANEALDELLDEMPGWGDEIQKERELATAMLEGYLEWLEETGADSDLTIQGTETKVEVKLVEGVHLISKLDAPVVRQRDGAKLAIEHKTVQAFDRPLMLLKLDTQMLTEHLVRFLHMQEEGATAEEAMFEAQGVLWNGLRKVKRGPRSTPPFYHREDVTHNLNELRNHWKHVVGIARDMQTRVDRLAAGETHQAVVPPNPTKDCKWDCPFFQVCGMFDDGSNVEGALEAMYEVGDPLARYEGADVL